MFVVATLNINGLNNVNKQLQLIDFVKLHNIDILMLQEHNLKSLDNVYKHFNLFSYMYVNHCTNSKRIIVTIVKQSLPLYFY